MPVLVRRSPLLSGHDHRCAVHRDMRSTMRRARLALAHSSVYEVEASARDTEGGETDGPQSGSCCTTGYAEGDTEVVRAAARVALANVLLIVDEVVDGHR